jgi:two-component system CheB/CheR fusion protein
MGSEHFLRPRGRQEPSPPPVEAQRLGNESEALLAAHAEAEAALARYTELFDLAPIGYATVTPDGTIDAVNYAGATILGTPRSLLVGERFAALIGDHSRAAFEAFLGQARHDSRETCDVELRPQNGRAALVRMTATMTKQAGSTILVTFVDITDQMSREKELARLTQASRRKDEFMAVLSHELRNPLAPISFGLSLLFGSEPGSEDAKAARDVIERQIKHMTRLIDDLLDMSRVVQGKIELRRERVDLSDLVKRTIEDHRPSFEASGIELEGRTAPGPCWVDGDPARLVQTLSNLLGNAEKLTPRGGSTVVSLERHGAKAALRVRDTGVGIDPEMVQHLFQPFSQAPEMRDRGKGGIGLGLAMVKGLIELHGGTVEIASEGRDRGTELTVWLPLDAAAAPRTAPSAQPIRPSRILLIEDHRDQAETLTRLLRLDGHDVVSVHDGPSGIETARRWRPEVVICDLGLPGLNGYEVARALRAEQGLRDSFLVALSGYALQGSVESAIRAGFDRYLVKPAERDLLNRLLAERWLSASPESRPAEPASPRRPA